MKNRELWILRHAHAMDPNEAGCPPERQRPLTAEGRQAAHAVGQWLARRGIRFDAVFTSPLVRARETADIVSGMLEGDAPVEDERLAPGAPLKRIRRLVEEQDGYRVLLAGHEPDLGSFLGDLLGCSGPIALKKAGLAAVRADEKGRAQLILFISPAYI